MSNYAQHIFTIPEAQGPIVITFSRSWDKLKSDQRALTRPEFRQLLDRDDNPAKVTIKASHPAYAAILAAGETSKAHIKRFADMEAKAKQAQAGLKLMATIKGILG